MQLIGIWWNALKFQSPNWKTRCHAAMRLGASDNVRAVKPLLAALRDERRGWRQKGQRFPVREAAAKALGTLRSGAAVPALLSALIESHVAVQSADPTRPSYLQLAIAEALERIDPHWTKSTAVDAAMPHFLRALKVPYEETQIAALHALAMIRDARVVPHIDPLTGGSRYDHASFGAFGFRPVVVAAAYALGEIGDESAVKTLEHILNYAPLEERRAAEHALERIISRRTNPAGAIRMNLFDDVADKGQ